MKQVQQEADTAVDINVTAFIPEAISRITSKDWSSTSDWLMSTERELVMLISEWKTDLATYQKKPSNWSKL
ncbi:MAG: hypothetical protein IPO31_05870 [Candidatus Obscuribacter sp.]|nr:hypothetical protein [Candidatus Obscuribacter sp.]